MSLAIVPALGLDEYQEFYYFDQGTQGSSETGAVQFNFNGAEPSYLIINGQNQPYNPSYVQYNSLWIQGTSRWTQYMQCPYNARFKLLAFTQGGMATVVEVYPSGYELVKTYQFYPGYTQFVFWADAVGRHTITFYINGQKSNSIMVDVLSSGQSGYGQGQGQSGLGQGQGQGGYGPGGYEGGYGPGGYEGGYGPGGYEEGYGPGGYDPYDPYDPYSEWGGILIDSADYGFDPYPSEMI